MPGGARDGPPVHGDGPASHRRDLGPGARDPARREAHNLRAQYRGRAGVPDAHRDHEEHA